YASGDVDITHVVRRVGQPGQAQVLAQEVLVELVAVLVGAADHERGHGERVRAGHERRDRLELLLPRQGDDQLAVAGAGLPLDAGVLEAGPDQVDQGRHGTTAEGTPARAPLGGGASPDRARDLQAST